MKTYIYIIAAMALLSMAAACNETETSREVTETIRFAGPVQTKAYTDAADHAAVFYVRDYFNGGAGTTPALHINNTLAYNGSWGYGSGSADQYEWKNGLHNLFGWLKTDGIYRTESFFSSDPSLDGTTLSIPAKALTNQTDQYDFLYSQSVQRNTAENDYSEVPLLFKHLFAQVAISFIADPNLPAGQEPRIYEVYLNNSFANKKSATINFENEGDPEVTYTAEAFQTLFAAKNSTMASSGVVYDPSTLPFDVMAQLQSAAKAYYFVWPMEASELENVLTVKYLYPGEGSAREITMSFPAGTSWQAGYKYAYTISYLGGVLKVKESVMPWDYTSTSGLSVETQSAVAAWIGWDTSTCDVSGQTATFKTASTPVRGIFRINSPTSCTYAITLTGTNAGKFSITSGASGTIGNGTEDIKPGENITFEISALEGASSGDEANLEFTVTVGGRTISLDSEIQRDGQLTIKR